MHAVVCMAGYPELLPGGSSPSRPPPRYCRYHSIYSVRSRPIRIPSLRDAPADVMRDGKVAMTTSKRSNTMVSAVESAGAATLSLMRSVVEEEGEPRSQALTAGTVSPRRKLKNPQPGLSRFPEICGGTAQLFSRVFKRRKTSVGVL